MVVGQLSNSIPADAGGVSLPIGRSLVCMVREHEIMLTVTDTENAPQMVSKIKLLHKVLP